MLHAVGLFYNRPDRPAIEYWLNEEQALFITAKSDDQGHTTSASNAGAGTETPKSPDASGGRCRQPTEAILEGVSTPQVIIGLRTIRHNLLRLLEPADQTAVLAINENDSLPTLHFI